MKKTYHGSCHCGAIRFAADIDLKEGTYKCNCSMCSKMRTWIAMLPPGAFRLLSGSVALADYQFGRKAIHHQFCRHCGIHPFGWSEIPETGERRHVVSLMCLDDISDTELAETPVTCSDGRNDNWKTPPAETRHL